MRDGAETGMLRDGSILGFFEIRVCSQRRLSCKSIDLRLARWSAKIAVAGSRQRSGDTGRGKSAHAPVSSSGFIQLFSEKTALSGERIQGRQRRRDFAVVVFDARRWHAASEGVVGGRATVAQIPAKGHRGKRGRFKTSVRALIRSLRWSSGLSFSVDKR